LLVPFAEFPIEGHILAAILVLFSVLTLIVYIDEIIFIKKRIRRGTRTMWVLACYPVSTTVQLYAADSQCMDPIDTADDSDRCCNIVHRWPCSHVTAW
jgi:hypothetical protein